MKPDRMLIVILLAGILAMSSSAFGISISISGDAGSFTEDINAGLKDFVNGYTVIAPECLSNSIEGGGSLRESHRVSNMAGTSASVGVDVRNAQLYSYRYYLSPGAGSSWSAKLYPEVSAGEKLDVVNAEYIKAYASARNARGMFAGVSTVLFDPEGNACLTGYSNSATASAEKVSAIQGADEASAPGGYIQTNAQSDLIQFGLCPLQLRRESEVANTTLQEGSITGFSDEAIASSYGAGVLQNVDSASGKWMTTESKSDLWLAYLSKGLVRLSAKESTGIAGTLDGYRGVAKSSNDLILAYQEGHISGAFSSAATAGRTSKTRSSNYGTDYDFEMLAMDSDSNSLALGALGYYVDINHPGADRIQGAVDASESGDTINVAEGTYRENVQIDKSLTVKGAGASTDPARISARNADTIVDGQKNGSVFTIGKNDPNADVSLQGLIIQNGSGTYTERWPGEPLVQCGGGIWNAGRLSLMDSTVSGNTANEYGSGIWSTGALTVDRSHIYGNGKPRDGGGIWSSGELIVRDSIVAGNEAWWNGGGIWSSGKMQVERSNVTGNTADYYGGGIASDMGQATVVDSTISGNTAALGGGGVYNIFGQVTLDDNVISRNAGNDGGGILNNGWMSVSGGSISDNNAANGGGIFNMGTMDLNGALVENNRATENGGGVYSSAGIFNLNGGSISCNNAYLGAGIFNSNIVNQIGGSIFGNNADENGGGIYNNYGTVNIDGGSIDSNTVTYYGGGGIYNNHGIVNLNNGFVSNNRAPIAGGIFSEYGELNLNGGYIDHNTANVAGGIDNYYGTLNLRGTSISFNTAYWGGGIFNAGSMNIDGSSIHHNRGIYGGAGIFNTAGATIDMIAGSISNNTATYEGGGVYNVNSGILNLNGGSIDHNNAGNGGGIYNSALTNLNGGSIDHNTAYLGGGIYNDNYGKVNLSMGSIDHNTATNPSPSGGGIYNLNIYTGITGNTDLVRDNTPDQIAPVDWLPGV